jgi:transcriptional regulator with XRE-family HTH domain
MVNGTTAGIPEPRHGAQQWGPRRTITAELAAMLAAARKAHGWSFREAARRVSCTSGSIAHWEAGRRAPSAYYADRLIEAYGLTGPDAERLLAEAVPDAGKSSPWRGGCRRR